MASAVCKIVCQWLGVCGIYVCAAIQELLGKLCWGVFINLVFLGLVVLFIWMIISEWALWAFSDKVIWEPIFYMRDSNITVEITT
jgi:hypothetical protein